MGNQNKLPTYGGYGGYGLPACDDTPERLKFRIDSFKACIEDTRNKDKDGKVIVDIGACCAHTTGCSNPELVDPRCGSRKYEDGDLSNPDNQPHFGSLNPNYANKKGKVQSVVGVL
jgi:hypothetical protein